MRGNILDKQANYISVLSAKSHLGEPQRFFVVLSCKEEWLTGMPHSFVGDAEVSGSVTHNDSSVTVTGSVRVPMQFVCDKCGERFTKNLLADLSAEYCEDGGEIGYELVSNLVNLQPAVRDAVLAAIPSQVLCKEYCKGLCPECGENLNFSSCRCKK